jgi:hypothetical protein
MSAATTTSESTSDSGPSPLATTAIPTAMAPTTKPGVGLTLLNTLCMAVEE